MKMIKKFIFLLIMTFIFIPGFVFAITPDVLIDNDEEGYTGTAVYDESAHTLTLNNYHGKSIVFATFDDTTDITLILKGANVIDSQKEPDELLEYEAGIVLGGAKNLNIKGSEGSSLTVNNYHTGILSYDGNININNATLAFNDIKSEGITVLYAGDLNITDTKITTNKTLWGMSARKDNVTFKHSTFLGYDGEDMISAYKKLSITDGSVVTGEKISLDLIHAYGDNDIVIDDSTISIKDSDGALIFIDNNDEEKGIVSITNSTLTAKNITNNVNDGGKDASAVFYMNLLKNLNFENTTIDIDNVINGFYSNTPNITFKDCTINMKGVYSAFEIMNYKGFDTSQVTFEGTKVNIDNSKTNRHLVYGFYVMLKNFNIIESDININNNSSSEYSYPYEYFKDFYDSSAVLYEMAITAGEFLEESLFTIKDSNINISAIYTKDVANKTPKTGVIDLFGQTEIDNSVIHINVDEDGVAFGNAVIEGLIDFNLISMKGNIKVYNEGYELNEYCFSGLCAHAFGGEIDTTLPEDIDDEAEMIMYMIKTLPNKLDIDGSIKVTYAANDGTNKVIDKYTTGKVLLPLDLFEGTDKKKFLG